MTQSYISFTIIDDKGERASRQVYIPNTVTLAQATTFAAALMAVVGPLLDGKLDAVTVTFALPVPTIVTSGASDVQEMARFAFTTAENFVSAITIPTVIETIFQAGSKLVDLTDTAVDTFLSLLLDGDGVVQPVDAHGDDLDGIDSAREAWGKYR